MIGITELMIVIGVFLLVGLHLATVRYLIRRQEAPDTARKSAPIVVDAAAPDRCADVNLGHNEGFAHAR